MNRQLLFVGYDESNLNVVANYYEYNHVLNKNAQGIWLYIDDDDDTIVDSFNFDLFKNLNRHNLVEKLKSFFTLPHTREKNAYYTELKSHFEAVFNERPTEIVSAFEMTIILIAQLCLRLQFHNANSRRALTCFNLPGGAGKTFQVDFLTKLFPQIRIACATAKACEHYENVKATTVHSLFGIDPKKLKISFDNNNKKYQDAIIFIDECSMISTSLLGCLVNELDLDRLELVFLGDFAQMLPVFGKCISEEKCLHVISNSPSDFYLPRFKNPDYANFMNLLRQKILDKPICLDSMNRYFDLMRSGQQEVVDFVDYACEYQEYLVDLFQKNNQQVDLKPFNPLISSINRTNIDLRNSIWTRLSHKYTHIDQLASTLYIRREAYNSCNYHTFMEILRNLPVLVGERVYKYSLLMCKKNIDKNKNIINGTYCILVDFQTNLDELDHKIVEFVVKNSTRYICIYEGDLKFSAKIYNINCQQFQDITLYSERLCDCEFPNINPNCLHYSLEVFYFQESFSITLHNLQGSTLNCVEKMIVDKNIFKRSILRPAYVLFSRFTDFGQLVIEKKQLLKLKAKLVSA